MVETIYFKYLNGVQIFSEIQERIFKYWFSNFHAYVKFTIQLHKIEKIMKLFFPIPPMLFKLRICTIPHLHP